jgi:hypothetical protein
MPVEAITARLFETPDGQLVVAFERLLPLPGEDEFDMTLRQREERKLAENVRRRQRPAAVPLLLEAGKLSDGQTLYLHKSVLPVGKRHLFDPSKVVFQARVCASKGTPAKFAWQPDADTPVAEYAPSAIAYEVNKAVYDYDGTPYSTAVATTFTVEPDGKTLADIALDEGLWSPTEAAD